MATKADLDAAIQSVIDGVHKLGTDLQAAIDALKAKIGGGLDPTDEIAVLQGLAGEIATIDQAALDAAAP